MSGIKKNDVVLHTLHRRAKYSQKRKMVLDHYEKVKHRFSSMKQAKTAARKMMYADTTLYGYFFTTQEIVFRGNDSFLSEYKLVKKRVFIGRVIKEGDVAEFSLKEQSELKNLLKKSPLGKAIVCRTGNFVPFSEDVEILNI